MAITPPVCVSPQKRSGWQSEWHFAYFFRCFPWLPCRVNDILYVYIGVRFCLRGANANACMYESWVWTFVFSSSQPVPYPLLCFSSQSYVSLTFSSISSAAPSPCSRSCRKCNHVLGAVWRWEEGAKRSLRERGEEKGKGICMCTQLPLRRAQSHLCKRTDTHSENSYFHPASSACVRYSGGEEVDWIISWASWSANSGLITLVSFLWVIAAQCEN